MKHARIDNTRRCIHWTTTSGRQDTTRSHFIAHDVTHIHLPLPTFSPTLIRLTLCTTIVILNHFIPVILLFSLPVLDKHLLWKWRSQAQISARSVWATSQSRATDDGQCCLVDHVSIIGLVSSPRVELMPYWSFAIILPPVGVFLERGCGADFLINICLVSYMSRHCKNSSSDVAFQDHSGIHVGASLQSISRSVAHFCFSSPGIIHALYIILKYWASHWEARRRCVIPILLEDSSLYGP